MPPASGLVIEGDSSTVSNVTVTYADDVGILVLGATNLTLQNPTVIASGRDGISISGGPQDQAAGYISIFNPALNNTGDDGISILSYLPTATDPNMPMQHDIWVDGEVYTNSGLLPTPGHGAFVGGGRNIAFTHFSISGSPAAAIGVRDGGGFNLAGDSNIEFNSGVIDSANTFSFLPPDRDGHTIEGAVIVDSETDAAGQTVNGVDIENLWINNTVVTAYRQVGDFANGCAPPDTPAPTNVTLKNFVFTGTEPHILFDYVYTANAGSGCSTRTTPSGSFVTGGWQITENGTTTALPDHPPGPPPAFP